MSRRKADELRQRLQRAIFRLECRGFTNRADRIRYAWLDWMDRQPLG